MIDKQDYGVHDSLIFKELKILKLADIISAWEFDISISKHHLLPYCFECTLLKGHYD